MWTSHRRTLHTSILITLCNLFGERANDLPCISEVHITTRSHYIYPVTTIGVGSICEGRVHRGYSNDSLIGTWVWFVVTTIIPCSEDDNPSLHWCICLLIAILITPCPFDEVVNSFLHRGRNNCDICCVAIPPRVLANNSSVIGWIDKSTRCICPFLTHTEDLTTHQPYTTSCCTIASCDTTDTDAVIITGGDCTCYVCAMWDIIREQSTIILNEVEAIDIINEAVVIIIFILHSILLC